MTVDNNRTRAQIADVLSSYKNMAAEFGAWPDDERLFTDMLLNFLDLNYDNCDGGNYEYWRGGAELIFYTALTSEEDVDITARQELLDDIFRRLNLTLPVYEKYSVPAGYLKEIRTFSNAFSVLCVLDKTLEVGFKTLEEEPAYTKLSFGQARAMSADLRHVVGLMEESTRDMGYHTNDNDFGFSFNANDPEVIEFSIAGTVRVLDARDVLALCDFIDEYVKKTVQQ